MIYPEPSQYIEEAGSFNVIPVYKEVRADFETPLSIFLKVKAKFLLESVERGENVGRYSIIALDRRSMIKLWGRRIDICRCFNGQEVRESAETDNPLEKVREFFSALKAPDYEGLPPFFGGAIGYLGYETVRYFEDIPVEPNKGDVPDGILIVPETLLVYDSVRRSVFIIVTTMPAEQAETAYRDAVEKIRRTEAIMAEPLQLENRSRRPRKVKVESNMERSAFLEAVKECQEFIRAGEVIQVVLSQCFSVNTAGSEILPFELYQSLRILNPSPYLFFLDFDDFHLIGSSPEVMVKVQNRELLLKPIAGTRPRGGSVAEDNRMARELLNDPKERAEHTMLIDLGRNDLGRVARPGTIEVTDMMSIEKYSHVMHIVSAIKGELDDRYDIFDVIEATFPAGTLTGAPKIRAMELIARMEPARRGPYGGMVFYLGFNGNFDSCITIRTVMLKDGIATVQAGAGIVADSLPENEFEETENKARSLIEAIRLAGTGRLK